MDILVSTLVSTDKNKEILIKSTEPWDKIKNLIKKITNKSGKYGKGFTKIKFNSNGKLSYLHYLQIKY